MSTLRTVALLALGGALGTIARYYAGMALARPAFPWGTVAVNAAGSFALAFFMVGLFLRGHADETWRIIFAVAFLGAFTTMSTFAYESVGMLFDETPRKAALHFLANPVLSILAAALGWVCGRLLPS